MVEIHNKQRLHIYNFVLRDRLYFCVSKKDGKRKGVPIIGNEVWIGVNAIIVGKVSIGDDVLIDPNAFVNYGIPSHSVGFVNPYLANIIKLLKGV